MNNPFAEDLVILHGNPVSAINTHRGKLIFYHLLIASQILHSAFLIQCLPNISKIEPL